MSNVDLSKNKLPYELIKEDAEQRGLKPLWHFHELPNIKFETEEEVKVIYIGGSDFKTWVNEAYQISSATWTNKVIDKTYEEKLESIKKEVYPTVPYEAFTFSVSVENVSRAILAQIQRHRGLYLHQFGYGELSTRNTDLRECIMRIPKEINKDEALSKLYKEKVNIIMQEYADLVDAGIPFEEARMIVPIGLCTYVTITGNLRVWMDYFKSRATNVISQYEHAVFADKVIDVFKENYPEMWEIIEPKIIKK